MSGFGRILRICLECAAIFRHLAVNGPVWLGDYTRAMTINRILTICAAAALGAAGTSLVHAQQGYPAPQVYSAAPQPYPPGGMPDFDGLDDDDAPQNSAALPPPGPVLSPNDPRYGRPMNAPVYTDRGQTGP